MTAPGEAPPEYEPPKWAADKSFLDEEGPIIYAIARHRGTAPSMYRGMGLSAIEQEAMRVALAPFLAEIERLRGYCREWSAYAESLKTED